MKYTLITFYLCWLIVACGNYKDGVGLTSTTVSVQVDGVPVGETKIEFEFEPGSIICVGDTAFVAFDGQSCLVGEQFSGREIEVDECEFQGVTFSFISEDGLPTVSSTNFDTTDDSACVNREYKPYLFKPLANQKTANKSKQAYLVYRIILNKIRLLPGKSREEPLNENIYIEQSDLNVESESKKELANYNLLETFHEFKHEIKCALNESAGRTNCKDPAFLQDISIKCPEGGSVQWKISLSGFKARSLFTYKGCGLNFGGGRSLYVTGSHSGTFNGKGNSKNASGAYWVYGDYDANIIDRVEIKKGKQFRGYFDVVCTSSVLDNERCAPDSQVIRFKVVGDNKFICQNKVCDTQDSVIYLLD